MGSHTLANVLATTLDNGCVAACGLAQGPDLPATVMPFILRGVTLAGVNSVMVPRDRRIESWNRLSSDLDPAKLASMTSVVGLADTIGLATAILDGRGARPRRGRRQPLSCPPVPLKDLVLADIRAPGTRRMSTRTAGVGGQTRTGTTSSRLILRSAIPAKPSPWAQLSSPTSSPVSGSTGHTIAIRHW